MKILNRKSVLLYFVLAFYNSFIFADTFSHQADKEKTLEEKDISSKKTPVEYSDNQTKSLKINEEPSLKDKNFIKIHTESEGRLLKNQISKNQKSFYPSIPYTEIGFEYSRNKKLTFFTNIEVEFYNEEWQISFDEIGAGYSFELVPLSIKAGWFPLPLGYMEKNINLFSQDLSIYKSLIKNQEDIGFTADFYMWKEILYLRVSRFGGWFYRDWDDFYTAPESAPFIVSINSEGDFWSAFISWFENDPAFFNPLQALGAGLELKLSYKKLGVSVRSEFWHTMEKGQSAFSYYVFPQMNVGMFHFGMLWGDLSRFSPNFQKSQVESSIYEKVFQFSCEVHPHVTVIGERFITRQKKGPLLNDSWAVRLKLHFDWSGRIFD